MKTLHGQENLAILLLGTGGTIAGLGGDTYRAAQLPIDALIATLAPMPAFKHRMTGEQLAQIDSKNMSLDVWERLYTRLAKAQNDNTIDAVIITHGTDTMEETAYFLHRTLACTKPVILTGAMRAADATDSDGARNLNHALLQATQLGSGVWVAFAGKVFSGGNVQKIHPTRLDAFEAIRADEADEGEALIPLTLPIHRWPRVEVVMSYAGASSALVEVLIAQKVDGIVVAGTGNATVHQSLEASLHAAAKAGIAVALSSRCLQGAAIKNVHPAFEALPLPPALARVELVLRLCSRV